MQEILSVSDVSKQIKHMMEINFSHIRIRGELIGVKTASSGHIYISLKDENSIIDAICWRGSSLPCALKDGIEVIATGKITTYALRSKYQLIINSIEMAGIGVLLQKLEALKTKLRQEGLFDSIHKKKLPIFPRAIGVITSETGAVIRDILHRIQDRFPCHVILWPCPVQGENSVTKITHAIQEFQSMPIDILIIARGGGSLEDLWCFNDERIVRAVYNAHVPIISAIGHETDTTLIDYVADVRAPTPTAAAEFAVPVLREMHDQINIMKTRLINLIKSTMNHYIKRINLMRAAIRQPDILLLNKTQQIDWAVEKIKKLQLTFFLEKETQLKKLILHVPTFSTQTITLEHLYIRLNNTSFEKTLKRGFTLAMKNGQPITYKSHITFPFDLHFQDGVLKNLSPVPDLQSEH